MQNQDSVVKVVDTTNTAQTAPLAKVPGTKHFDFDAVTGGKGAFKSTKMYEKIKAKTDSLSRETHNLTVEKGNLTAEITGLNMKVNALTVDSARLEKQVDELQGKVSQLTQERDSCKEQQPLVNIMFTPPGCYVTIVLVIALTIICLKKGFSIAKGDIKITTGDTKKGE